MTLDKPTLLRPHERQFIFQRLREGAIARNLWKQIYIKSFHSGFVYPSNGNWSLLEFFRTPHGDANPLTVNSEERGFQRTHWKEVGTIWFLPQVIFLRKYFFWGGAGSHHNAVSPTRKVRALRYALTRFSSGLFSKCDMLTG